MHDNWRFCLSHFLSRLTGDTFVIMSAMRYERKCIICGTQFIATRKDAACCSPACRKQKERLIKREDEEGRILEDLRMALPRPQKPRPATINNIADTLTDLKGTTTMLRFYARSCEPSIRPRLTVLADCIDEAIKEVGF